MMRLTAPLPLCTFTIHMNTSSHLTLTHAFSPLSVPASSHSSSAVFPQRKKNTKSGALSSNFPYNLHQQRASPAVQVISASTVADVHKNVSFGRKQQPL